MARELCCKPPRKPRTDGESDNQLNDTATTMRDTDYARELVLPAVLEYSDGTNEARLERLYVKAPGTVEIRLSWWKDGCSFAIGPARGRAMGVAHEGHPGGRPDPPFQQGSARFRGSTRLFGFERGVRHSRWLSGIVPALRAVGVAVASATDSLTTLPVRGVRT